MSESVSQQDNWTPLMYCVKEGHSEVVKLLLKNEELDILATNKVCGCFKLLICLKYYIFK